MAMTRIRTRLRRFAGDDQGVAMIEFALSLPLLILLFGVVIEGARTMWSFQKAAEGVREATRYLARITPTDICATGGSVAGQDATMTTMIAQSLSGVNIHPQLVTIVDVAPTLKCVAASTPLGVSPTPVAQITATFAIQHPFAPLLRWFGDYGDAVTVVFAEESRIYGQ